MKGPNRYLLMFAMIYILANAGIQVQAGQFSVFGQQGHASLGSHQPVT